MGHDFCAEHCLCLWLQGESSGHQSVAYVYDPFRCDVCKRYIRDRFQGARIADDVRSIAAEMESHIRKLRPYLESLEGNQHLKVSSFVQELRKKVKDKQLDWDYFRDL